MTIDEAIGILERANALGYTAYLEGFGNAVRLGIEALKAIRADRGGDASLLNRPLPGETKD